ncbi:radical SAM protein [Actinokineospora soli]|uniref:Heme chaperone HemW n=1 Tax=Actinokineospora soli TaxID=1048753 RepID=A0ABW2TP98_9PSEU
MPIATAGSSALESSLRLLPSSTDERHMLMIYVHVPFCHSKCTFCDWVQDIPTKDLLRKPEDSVRQKYIKALCREIEVRGAALTASGQVPYVIYWGGGTASSLDEDEATAIMTAIRNAFDVSTVDEATIECSPDTVDEAKLRFFRDLGFNRVSSGVQSFDDSRLRRLGRRHNADQADRIVHAARAAGFDQVSIDIMSGFPDQEMDELTATVDKALSLPLTHLSLYSFRPTPGTFMRRKLDTSEKREYLRRQQLMFTAPASASPTPGTPSTPTATSAACRRSPPCTSSSAPTPRASAPARSPWWTGSSCPTRRAGCTSTPRTRSPSTSPCPPARTASWCPSCRPVWPCSTVCCARSGACPPAPSWPRCSPARPSPRSPSSCAAAASSRTSAASGSTRRSRVSR